MKQSTASRTAATAAIANADAELASKKSTLAKSKVDVAVARADLAVAESEARRLKAWVGYLTLNAPFDGVIEARNANTFDFVSPSTGDPTAMQRAPHLSPQKTAPIYVVDRIDVVRVFVDVPERDANYVRIGTKASVLRGRTATRRFRPASRARAGPSMSGAVRSAPRLTCPTPIARSCRECTPMPK